MKTKRNYKALSMSLIIITSLLPATVSAQLTLEQRNAKAAKVVALYKMAEQAYRDGDIDVARDTLKIVLAEQPGHPHAIAMLKRMKLNGSQLELTRKKRIFNSVIINEVDFKGVNLSQALKILNEQIMVASGKKVIPNFVLTDPKKKLGKERIELQMSNVPAGVVLDHLMIKAGATAKFGKYSITVRPRPSVHEAKSIAKPKKKEDGF